MKKTIEKDNNISLEQLYSLLHYNRLSGEFIWLCGGRGWSKFQSAGAKRPDGYEQIRVGGKTYLSHRLAYLYVYGFIPKEVDHINRNRSDNRISNLRDCTPCQNRMNHTKYKNNKSGTSGVTWSKIRDKWQVRVNINKKTCHFGFYSELELAELISTEARSKYHKEFSNASY